MTTKAFSILLLTTLVLGVALGGAFAGGFTLGRSGQAAQTPESQSLRPPTGGQAAGQAAGRARAGQAQSESGDVAGPRSGAAPDQGVPADASAARPAGRQGADGSAVTADASANRGEDASGVQEVFGSISSLEGDLVTLESPRGRALAAISETTVIQRRVMGTVEDLSVGSTVQVSGRPGEDGQIQARSLTLLPAGDGSAAIMLEDVGRGGPGVAVSLLGLVESLEEGAVTIAGAQGTKRVSLGPAIAVWKLETGSRADLVEGAVVRITGSAGAEGQVQADVVMLVPEGASRGGRRGAGAAGQGSP